jgi:hypothetical protein
MGIDVNLKQDGVINWRSTAGKEVAKLNTWKKKCCGTSKVFFVKK